MLNVLDPDVVVFGGGLSNLERLFADLGRAVAAYAFADAVGTRFARAAHGDAGGVRGAAWLWPAGSA